MIVFENNNFYLETDNTSYVMRVLENGLLSNVYYGKKVGRYHLENFLLMRPMTNSVWIKMEGDYMSPLTLLPEMPTFGRGDFGLPALSVIGEDRRFVNELVFETYEILEGKPAIKGMPSFDANTQEVSTLKITLCDKPSGYKVNLYYSVFEKEDAITRHSEIVNICDSEIWLQSAASAALEFRSRDFDVVALKGGAQKERQIERYGLHQGISSVESRRGYSSHQLNPFIALTEKDANENAGEVYGFSLVYSGDFKISVEKSEAENVRVIAGINPETFCWRLKPRESFETPECVLTYSAEGLNGMSQHFHELCRKHLGKCADTGMRHPIVINSWEATYFDFDEAKIIDFIKSCKGLGIDTVVMDDGWFGHRDGDTSSLGDWFIDQRKFPNGLSKVIETCKQQGMQFGIWFEPEMVSPDSELFRKHPDWCIHTPSRKPAEGRNQLVLDMSRPEVVDYIFDMLSKILTQNDISYVKWDLNRNITDNGSDYLGYAQGEHTHRNTLGVYDLMERLTKKHPQVFFEGCAGGGGRFDFGILYYMPQIWASDDTDPMERLRIQYGTSLVYPPSTIVAHISASPSHQTGRNTPFKTRNDVAQMCSFGYELHVSELSENEVQEIPKQIEEHRCLEPLINYGKFYRLLSPFTSKQCAWELVSENQEKAYVMVAAASMSANDKSYYVKPKGLHPNYVYQVSNTRVVADGETIMNIGIPVKDPLGEYETRTYYLTRVN